MCAGDGVEVADGVRHRTFNQMYLWLRARVHTLSSTDGKFGGRPRRTTHSGWAAHWHKGLGDGLDLLAARARAGRDYRHVADPIPRWV